MLQGLLLRWRKAELRLIADGVLFRGNLRGDPAAAYAKLAARLKVSPSLHRRPLRQRAQPACPRSTMFMSWLSLSPAHCPPGGGARWGGILWALAIVGVGGMYVCVCVGGVMGRLSLPLTAPAPGLAAHRASPGLHHRSARAGAAGRPVQAVPAGEPGGAAGERGTARRSAAKRADSGGAGPGGPLSRPNTPRLHSSRTAAGMPPGLAVCMNLHGSAWIRMDLHGSSDAGWTRV